jgi:hypothetical protein
MSNANARDLIFIVGMHRSGTSALTRILSLCGAALPRTLMAPNSGNPTGYWEPHDAAELNDRFLRARSSSWSDPGLSYRDAPREPGAFARYVVLIRHFLLLIDQLLSTEFEPGGPVVLKEPRISALLPFWLKAATDAGFSAKAIHIFRHPADVARSLAARDGMDAERAFTLWQKYNLLAECDTREIPRSFASYEALMDDWASVVARCTNDIGVDVKLRAKAKRAVAAYLSPELHHDRSATIPRNVLGPAQRKAVQLAYDALRQAADAAPDTAAFDSLLLEYSARWVGAMGRHVRGAGAPNASPARMSA